MECLDLVSKIFDVTMQKLAPVYRNSDDLLKGTEEIPKIMKKYKDVGVTDRTLVWNTDLIETLELENLLNQVLSPRDALPFLGCCKKLATVAPRAAVLFACSRPPISTKSDLSVEQWKEIWRQACQAAFAQSHHPWMWAYSESATSTVRHLSGERHQASCCFSKHGDFLSSFANSVGDVDLASILMVHTYEIFDYTSPIDAVMWQTVALGVSSDGRFLVFDAQADFAEGTWFAGGTIHVADTLLDALYETSSSFQWCSGKFSLKASQKDFEVLEVNPDTVLWTPGMPRLTRKQARKQEAWRSHVAKAMSHTAASTYDCC